MLKNKQGITLVELLIVIVILGIIAAIAIPAVGNIVENTQKDAFISDAQAVRAAARNACLTETGGDWDAICDGGNSEYFSNDEEGTIDLAEEGYLDIGEDRDYKAWNNGDKWLVVIYDSSNEWFLLYDHEDGAERGDIVDDDARDEFDEYPGEFGGYPNDNGT